MSDQSMTIVVQYCPQDLPDLKNVSSSFPVSILKDSFNPLVDLKRRVYSLTNIPPVFQRLSIVSENDSFQVPFSMKLAVRKSRKPTRKIIVKSMSEKETDVFTVDVDEEDTILDLKFLLTNFFPSSSASPSPVRLLDAQPENLVFYAFQKGKSARVRLLDNQTVKQASISDSDCIRYTMEFPSYKEGHGTIHRMRRHLTASFDEKVDSIADNFRRSVTLYGDRPLFGSRSYKTTQSASGKPVVSRGEYVWQTYKQVEKRADNLSAALKVKLGLNKNDTVGIISINRPAWTLLDLSCTLQSLISVPLYDTLGPSAVEYIVKHAEVKVVFTEGKQLRNIAEAKKICPSLQYVVLLDDEESDKPFLTREGEEKLYDFRLTELEKFGADHGKIDDVLPSAEDIYTLCYTSGTTGEPKGAILTHANILSSCAASRERLPPEMDAEVSVVFSYLPLAHIYERVTINQLFYAGKAVGFYTGDTTKLLEDIATLKPSLVPGVPRVWQRIADGLSSSIEKSNIVQRSLFNKAFREKMAQIHQHKREKTLWDKLVFSKINEKFGGKLRALGTGSAPLSSSIAMFLRISLGVELIEGYGMTETAAIISQTDWDNSCYGIVGTVTSCNEVKLVDIPDMNYFVNDKPFSRGEIWVRGHNIFKGYYKSAKLTSEALTEDGWLMTGDVGQWLPDGNLQIIDRKKNIFKLSQGEYVRPEYVETVYKSCNLIASIYCHGDSLQSYLVGVIVPDFEALSQWAKEQNIQFSSKEELAKNPQARKLILQKMNEVADRERLNGYERIKKICLATEEFSVQSGILTPTMKLKRPFAKKKFEQEIKQLYDEDSEEKRIEGEIARDTSSKL